jgi:MFS family permease
MNSIVVRRIVVVLVANTLLRIAASSGTALIAFYLAATNPGVAGAEQAAAIVGILGVILNLAELFGAIPVGVATDRFSARSVLVIGALAGGIATMMYGLSQAIVVFFIARAIQGVVAVVGGPPLLALITEATVDDQQARNRVVGFYELSLLSGVALGGLVGGLLWSGFGITAFFILAALYLGVAALFWWGAQLPGELKTERPFDALRHALLNPTLLRLTPAWLALNAIIGLWLSNVIFQLSRAPVEGQILVGRFQSQQVGIIMLVYSIIFALGILVWTFLMGRVTRVATMRYALYGLLGTTAILYALNNFAWEPAIEWVLVAIGAVTVAIGSGFTPAALAYLASLADEGGRGSTMGVYTVLLGLGNAIGAGVGGWLASGMAFNGLIIGTLVLVIAALVSVTQLPEKVGLEVARSH